MPQSASDRDRDSASAIGTMQNLLVLCRPPIN